MRDKTEAILRRGGEIALEYFHNRKQLVVDRKGCQDFVSEADRQVEQFLKKELKALYPDDSFLGEEYGKEIGAHGESAIWVIDPIDGTTNFLRGIPEFAITLCRIVNGKPEEGYIYQPAKDEMICASAGHGAWHNGQSLMLSPRAVKPEDALIGFGYSISEDRPERAFALLKKWREAGSLTRQTGAAATGLYMAITGQVDGFYEPFLNSWDALAGQLIAEEIGMFTSPFLCGEKLQTGGSVWIARPELSSLFSES